MNADHFQAMFWSLTYILLIIHSFHYKNHGIPLTAMSLNFAWETVALYDSLHAGVVSYISLIHITWFSLDLIMVSLFLVYETSIFKNKCKKICFVCGYLVSTICLVVLFNRGHMLLSCFAIDLIMAAAFLLHVLLEYPNRNPLIYLIGFFKLLGDLCAWYYYRDYLYIHEIGTCVFIFNVIYIMILASQEGPLVFLGVHNSRKNVSDYLNLFHDS